MSGPPDGVRARRRAAPAAGAVTLADVARAAGVSVATASRAINGSVNRAVGAELRARVLATADRLGYSPNAHAQAMARGRTAALGLVVHDIADPYFSAIAAGVTEAADEAGLLVTLANTNHDADRELELVRTLQNQRVRAMVLVGSRSDDGAATLRLRRALDAYQARGGTVALVSQPVLGASTVRIDNAGGSAELARALHGRGYRRFAVLTGPPENLTARDRAAGFAAGLAELGVTVPAAAQVPGPLTRDGGHAAMGELLGRRTGAEVVFAVTDVMALGAMTAAREAGVAVPTETAFAGFDDIPTLQDVTPALTTVRIPMPEIGRQVTRLALADPAEGPHEVVVAGEVVLRASTPGPA
ncbi:LacI family transcriptional regulator [Georgenia sp. TF02-10]|uniref:LacI family DNA-binding transcriptional regulator n=1 Tax=Georgenia sp. TF02-10 TaxID=2917725 RepID=UPI001FA77BE2|nr:LacI family DNA-binding transcriptional regulator [Georgenia sp. TF02-10]UNX53737.1 LacI family transcriptional regulator [Georgenia sp. TF02-10]